MDDHLSVNIFFIVHPVIFIHLQSVLISKKLEQNKMINKGVLRQFLAATAGKKNQIASSEIINRLYNYTVALAIIIYHATTFGLIDRVQ